MLFIMRGTSCSGKSTFLKEYFKDQDQHIVSSDKYREILFGSAYIQSKNRELFDFISKIIEIRMLSHVQWTAYDATNLRMSDSSSCIELCKKYKVPYTFLSIDPPDCEELKRRNRSRGCQSGLQIPEDVLEKHYKRYHDNTKYFVEEAVNSPLASFIEFDQYRNVKNYVA